MADMHIPALSVLIFDENEVLYEKNLGSSDLDKQIALESNHLFLLASIFKTITATALLQLYDKGLLQLDEAINDYLPFDVNIPNKSTVLNISIKCITAPETK
jgi:CubicO group peptidase (beta-lactamase class C family)